YYMVGQRVLTNSFDPNIFTIDYAGISSNGSSSANTIAGQPINFEKVDDKTLKIQLPQPYATYVRTLDQMCVLPSHAFDGDATKVNDSDYFKKPGFASSGAYVVSEINDDNIVFTARDDYYRGTPSVKKIIMKTIGSGSTSDIALENDEISYMRVTTADQLEKYKKASDEYTLYELSEARLNYLQINPASNLSDDERKAIFLALDAQEIIDAAYGTDELAQPANSLMTPDQSFYDKDCKGYSQDIETAKKLAESSGLTGKTINYKFNSDRANMEAVATVVQQQLEKIGVKVNVQGADSTTFFKSFFYMWYGSGEKDTSWDLASNGWDSERGTDLGQSLSYFNSSFGYSDEIKTLAQQINATVDQDEAKTLAKDLQQKTLDEYYQYPLTYTNYIMVSKKNVTGLDTCKIIPEFNDYLEISVK
ncbi:ABC transporter substrate-binding protein, partial [Dorea formicigenerans]|uniref:ABC transporter substrate-binding protein n=1 Tax=Dorea formicigenerans TaxID=39486 RepID=UPI001D075900